MAHPRPEFTSFAEKVDYYHKLVAKFRRACSQVVLLNNAITDCQTRYDRAMKEDQPTFRYIYRLRLMIIEDVRDRFYEYAVQVGGQIDNIQAELYND